MQALLGLAFLAIAWACSVQQGVYAQTPVDVAVANDLRTCLRDHGEIRDGPTLWDLSRSIADMPNNRWISFIESAPGTYRAMDRSEDIVVEIRLPDTEGTAHCLAFGPKIGPGDGARILDTFVSMRFLSGLVPAEFSPGFLRRYTYPGLPYSADLVAFTSPGLGEVVGFVFSGLQNAPIRRTLSNGDPAVSSATVQAFAGWALEVCVAYFRGGGVNGSTFESAGFEVGYAAGDRPELVTYFLPDNSVSVRFGQALCYVETTYLNAAQADALSQGVMNSSFPGVFRPSNGYGRCSAYYGLFSGDVPVIIYVESPPIGGESTCAANAPVRLRVTSVG